MPTRRSHSGRPLTRSTIPTGPRQPTFFPPLSRRELRCKSLAATAERQCGFSVSVQHARRLCRRIVNSDNVGSSLLNLLARLRCPDTPGDTLRLWCLTGSPLLLASDRQQIGQNSHRSHKIGSSGYRRFGGDLRWHRLLTGNEPTKQLFRLAPCLACRRTIAEVRIDIAFGKVGCGGQIDPIVAAVESGHGGFGRALTALDLDREPSCQRSHECPKARKLPRN